MLKISQNIELMNIIGKGAYGDVFMGINTKTKEIYAIKKITKKQLESEIIYQYFNNEIFILKHLNHPNIIKFKSLTEYKSDYYLSTEYCNGGSLEQAMKYHSDTYGNPINEEIARYFIYNILHGIIYLNKNNLIHRDIKSDNILLHYENEEDLITHNFLKAKIKIIDFGFARYLEQDELAGSLVGTPMYMEPSILKTFMTSKSRVVDGFYDKKVDVWSLGILTYELLIGIVPFVARNIKGLFHSVEQRDFCIPKEEKRTFKLSEAAINFIDKTLNIDMNRRPLPEELIKDPWIMGKFNKKKLYNMKSDKEIALVEKKTSFENFWKLSEEFNNSKIASECNSFNNSINLKKKKKLEIIGLSYVDPSKLNNMKNEKKINNSYKIKQILSSKKKKKLLTNFEIKLKEKGNEIRSRQTKNKDLNLLSKLSNKTEMNINKNYNDDFGEEVGVPELSPKRRNKPNQKMNTICQITVSNLNKYDNNNNNNNSYIHNTISSCRHSNTNGNIYYIKSETKNTKIYSNFNTKVLKNLKAKQNSNSLRTLDIDKRKIKRSNNSLNHNNNYTGANQKNIISISNNCFINNNNSSYINTETRIYRKKISIRKNYKNNNKEDNNGNEGNELKSSKNMDKPKTVRVKKLQLFKVPLIDNKKIYKINKKFKCDQKDINEVESD
mgnify:CR=1 FL=1